MKQQRRSPPEKVREKGAIVKTSRDLISVALVYPNTYGTGMSSLGFQTVYGLVNDLEGVACERVFLPEDPDQTQAAVSCETARHLDRFQIIAVSVSFENDYLNLVSMLRHAGIPLRSSQRNSTHPLVMAGGVACFLNPAPLSPFVDVFLLGEAEELIPEFFHVYDRDLPREVLLKNLAQNISGAYVPCFYRPIYSGGVYAGTERLAPDVPLPIPVRRVRDLGCLTTVSRIISSHTAFRDICLVETGRGCPHGCRFCSAGFIYRPPRFYPEASVIRSMETAAGMTNKIGLVSAAVSDHPGINRICARGIERNLRLSFSSLRVDSLSDELILSLKGSGVKTATIAPEAGSDRMRRIINKKITAPEILSGVKRLVESNIINLKLYFMIGLPLEADEDVQAIVDLVKVIWDVFLETSRAKGRIGAITLSINPFVPKPATPFQWESMAPEPVLTRRMAIVRRGLKDVPNLRINTESLRIARMNSQLATGDARMADILEEADLSGWARAVQKVRKSGDYSLDHIRTPGDPLPWDIIDTGVSSDFLVREFHRASLEKTSPDCPMIACDRCGICH
ncbi:MAG: radical SAM protein [Pseudomonadota bacterium]